MDKVPRIFKFTPLTVVGFYDYLDINECILKGMKKSITFSCNLPEDLPSRDSLIGKFHHSIMEELSSYANIMDLQNSIEHNMSLIQTEVDKWPHLKKSNGAVCGWSEIHRSATYALNAFTNKSYNTLPNNLMMATELTLYSLNKILIGRPDLFYIHGNIAYLKEFKSTSIRDNEGAIRTAHEFQLYFYASLLFDNYNIDSVVGSLESMSGDRFSITILRAEAEAITNEIYKTIANANDKISSCVDIQDLASPSLIACQNCQMKVICSKFKAEQINLNLPYDTYVLDGVLVSFMPDKTSKVVEVEIFNNISKKNIKITIPARYKDDLKINLCYVFENLKYSNDTFFWSSRSRIFLNDNK